MASVKILVEGEIDEKLLPHLIKMLETLYGIKDVRYWN